MAMLTRLKPKRPMHIYGRQQTAFWPSDLWLIYKLYIRVWRMTLHDVSPLFQNIWKIEFVETTHGPSMTFRFWSASTTLHLTNGQLQKKLPKAWYFAGYLFSHLARPLALGSLHPRGTNPTVAWIPHHVILQEEPKHSRSDEDRQDAGDPQKDRRSRNPWRPTADGCGEGEIYGLGDRLGNQVNLHEKAFNYVWRYLNSLLRKSR